jgi:hypothetical protein
MGNILKLLSRDGDSCCTMQQHDIFVDFESAQPTHDEVEIYNETEILLNESETILKDLLAYKGLHTLFKQSNMFGS